jgi:hypothetical protein
MLIESYEEEFEKAQDDIFNSPTIKKRNEDERLVIEGIENENPLPNIRDSLRNNTKEQIDIWNKDDL